MAENKDIVIKKPHAGGQEAFVRSSVDVCIFGGSLGGGKACLSSSCVLTPNGWVKNKDLKIGDYICTPFDKPQPIKGLYPQGIQDIYTFRTADGRSVDCTLDHLWEVRTTKQVHKYRKHHQRKNFMVWTTKQVMDYMADGKSLYLQIPNAQEFGEKDLPIDPYLFGVLIGDGCLTPASLSEKKKGLTISNSEDDIVNKCFDILKAKRVRCESYNYNKTFYGGKCEQVRDAIISLGLNTYSYNKFIPKVYLFSSIEQRRALLAGLFDTDGCVEDRGHFSFSTTSDRLKDDFIHLCRSLGYIATARADARDKYTDGHIAWDITIRTQDRIFRSVKHNRRQDENEAKYDFKYHKTNDHVLIESITYSRREEAQCLYIDHPDHLYIVDDFITTHNTGGSILAVAEPSLDPRFRAIFLRRTLGELKTAGGIVDEFENMYGNNVAITKSENPRITFKHSGAWIECRQVADENPNKVREAFKGLQADAIFFDELTGFEFYTWNYLMSRCRGMASWTGKIRATTNPSKKHWVRKMLNWYIGPDGYVIPERSGVVRYFYLDGNSVDDYVWGDTKEEVYMKCKPSIDKSLRKLGNSTTYEHLIKSFTFILGSLSENTTLLTQNPDYVGSVSGTEGAALLEGNWNVDLDELEDMPIQLSKARAIAENDPVVNSDRWITADLGYEGSDNTVILAWDGFHILDIKILEKGTTASNAKALKEMARKWDVGDSHIIFDAIGSYSILDYIPDAVAYKSSLSSQGMYRNSFERLKDEVYMRLVEAINDGRISMSESVANTNYTHQKIKTAMKVLTEFVEECSVVRFATMGSGKKKLESKKAMNALLGKSRSMDLLDPCAMRFFPCIYCEYGSELSYGIMSEQEEEEAYGERVNIFDDSFWC